jgi:hypothetical protein
MILDVTRGRSDSISFLPFTPSFVLIHRLGSCGEHVMDIANSFYGFRLGEKRFASKVPGLDNRQYGCEGRTRRELRVGLAESFNIQA